MRRVLWTIGLVALAGCGNDTGQPTPSAEQGEQNLADSIHVGEGRWPVPDPGAYAATVAAAFADSNSNGLWRDVYPTYTVNHDGRRWRGVSIVPYPQDVRAFGMPGFGGSVAVVNSGPAVALVRDGEIVAIICGNWIAERETQP